MLGVTAHLDEFTLLRFAALDLSGEELGTAKHHLSGCAVCNSLLEGLRELDGELRALASTGAMREPDSRSFAPDDPFRARPVPRTRRLAAAPLDARAVEASENGLRLQESLLDAVRTPPLIASRLAELDPTRADHRFAVLYALQESGRRSAESPFGSMTLAGESLRWLRRAARSENERPAEQAERLAPRLLLRAQANLLLGVGRLWTKEYSKARGHLLVAYRSFGRAGGDLTNLAVVEMAESQRRGLSGEGVSALALARRARETFADLGLEDYAARAMVAEGLALDQLDRLEEAVDSCRRALPIFERYGVWSNYVGALNTEATFLIKMGRLAEARREFARALRRFSQERHRFWLGYIRVGLAETLFAAGDFAEAAVSAARASRVFADCSLRAHALIALLLEVECWARCGSLERARHRLEIFWAEIDRDGALDPFVIEQLTAALSGSDPNFERLSSLRQQVGDLLQERYRAG